MNNDLISRAALLKEIRLQKSYAGAIRQQTYRTGFIVSLSMLEGKTANMPTVDAEPVRHGRWLSTSDKNKKRCSVCDIIHLIAQYPHGQANYCPNCGAKMDLEVQHE